ncbi:hypothetical protein [Halioglobus sp. HI00S01]|uniref:hypothetical protein n=1 Tax=Halioglobus sp. HI00S01 TaxID=1822214 RepID=UPI0012E88A8E|nr:hypothetical protein [Halioglobus sp. HI00S01]
MKTHIWDETMAVIIFLRRIADISVVLFFGACLVPILPIGSLYLLLDWGWIEYFVAPALLATLVLVPLFAGCMAFRFALIRAQEL